MKKGKAVGPYELLVEVWKCMGKMEIKFDQIVQQTING